MTKYSIAAGVADSSADARYTGDRKLKSADLTEDGRRTAPRSGGHLGHVRPVGPYLLLAVKAKALYLRDVHYIVREGVMIVDESRSRAAQPPMEHNIHQAVEAKEGVESNAKTPPWRPSRTRFVQAVRQVERNDRHGVHRAEERTPPTVSTPLTSRRTDPTCASINPTPCSAPPPRGGTPSSISWCPATGKDAPCSWAPPAWNTANTSPSSFASTGGRRDGTLVEGVPQQSLNAATATRRQGGGEIAAQSNAPTPSPSPPTWPGGVRTSSWVGTRRVSRVCTSNVCCSRN